MAAPPSGQQSRQHQENVPWTGAGHSNLPRPLRCGGVPFHCGVLFEAHPSLQRQPSSLDMATALSLSLLPDVHLVCVCVCEISGCGFWVWFNYTKLENLMVCGQ